MQKPDCAVSNLLKNLSWYGEQWKIMKSFLGWGHFHFQRKKNHCCLSCEDSTYFYDFSLNVLYNPDFISIILSLARLSRNRA